MQEEAIKEAIMDAFPGTGIEVIWTERMFREQIESILQSPPDLIILDGMIRWTDPSEASDESSIPDDVKEDGPYRAGLRCQQILAKQAPDIPLFFYTILEREDINISKNLCYLSKREDPGELIQKIRTLLRQTN